MWSRNISVIERTPSVLNTMFVGIFIMTMVATVALVAYFMVRHSQNTWRHTLEQEITVQILPLAGTVSAQQIEKVKTFLEKRPEIQAVQLLSKDKSYALLEPWLGPSALLQEVPLPRLLAVSLIDPQTFSLKQLQEDLDEGGQGAVVFGHRFWIEKIDRFSRVLEGMMVLVLGFLSVCAAMMTTFSCRNVVLETRGTITVLYLFGASDDFVAHHLEVRVVKTAFWASVFGCAGGFFWLAVFGGLDYVKADGVFLRLGLAVLKGSSPEAGLVYGSLGALALFCVGLCVVTARMTLRRHLAT